MDIAGATGVSEVTSRYRDGRSGFRVGLRWKWGGTAPCWVQSLVAVRKLLGHILAAGLAAAIPWVSSA